MNSVLESRVNDLVRLFSLYRIPDSFYVEYGKEAGQLLELCCRKHPAVMYWLGKRQDNSDIVEMAIRAYNNREEAELPVGFYTERSRGKRRFNHVEEISEDEETATEEGLVGGYEEDETDRMLIERTLTELAADQYLAWGFASLAYQAAGEIGYEAVMQEAYDLAQKLLKPRLNNPDEMRKLFTSLEYLDADTD